MKILLIALAMLFTSICYSQQCEINGKAILWAYDARLWEFETDDTLHPGVIVCVEKYEKYMKSVSTCEAKKTFKRKICDLIIEYQTEDTSLERCMSEDKPLGPSVRNSGI